MKQHKIPCRILTVSLLVIFPAFVFADVGDIVSQFNSMNGNTGFAFNVNTTVPGAYMGSFSTIGAGELQLINAIPTNEIPNLSAYASVAAGSNWFRTFCVTPEQSMLPYDESKTGKLNYSNNRTLTTTAYNPDTFEQITPMPLSFGAAYLYKQYASGALSYNYNGTTSDHMNDARDLQVMIWYLQGRTSVDGVNIADDISSNQYYIYLINSGISMAEAMAAYNLNSTYGGLMDDYKVFVMNTKGLMRSGEAVRQDVLYVVRDGSNNVPEPASLLLWTLGSLGVAGVTYRKRRMNNK